MKRILIGTTNPSKVKRFQDLLKNYKACFITLNDLHITEELDENGTTPKENAEIKAKFYGKYFDYVICNDSGLYFDNISFDDERQPGLHIRTPQGVRLDDEEMIQYYTELISSSDGKILCYYLDGIAVYNKGKINSFMENSKATKASAFFMVNKPHTLRHPGWPLDSISIDKNTGRYFVEQGNNKNDTTEDSILLGEYRKRLTNFLVEALELQ